MNKEIKRKEIEREPHKKTVYDAIPLEEKLELIRIKNRNKSFYCSLGSVY